jgi:hypothetical protein
MALNFEGWLHPYVWQLTSRPPNPDSLWGFMIKELGGGYIDFCQARNLELANTINAILYVTLSLSYLAILYFRRKENLMGLGFYCITIFLLFNKIYSPQYNLWLLPFVFFMEMPTIPFYLFDIPSFLILGAHTPWFILDTTYSIHIAILLILRHMSLILMLWTNMKKWHAGRLEGKAGFSIIL